MVFALTRTDKMDLDVFLGICEKAIVSRILSAVVGLTPDKTDTDYSSHNRRLTLEPPSSRANKAT
jgi:hypothetical protein